MRKNPWIMMAVAVTLVVFGVARGGEAEKKGADPEAKTPDKVIAENQSKGFYTILVLHKGEASAKELLAALTPLARETGKAECLAASVQEASLGALFKSLNLDPEVTPTPLALVLAPNGIVTGAFRSAPKAEKFAEAILPEQPLAIRKALNDGKTVFVKMQSPKTSGNAETNKALDEYLADPKSKGKFVLLPLDLDKPENARFLNQLGISDPEQEKQAILLAMAPPLKIVSKPYRGAATKDVLGAFIASCGSACGPSG